MAESARVIVEVTAGLIPGQPDDVHTRRFLLSPAQWDRLDPAAQMEALALLNGRAQGYAGLLALQPNALNWVRWEWIYL